MDNGHVLSNEAIFIIICISFIKYLHITYLHITLHYLHINSIASDQLLPVDGDSCYRTDPTLLARHSQRLLAGFFS